MATTVWKGHLTFGLISMPVRMFAAALRDDLAAHGSFAGIGAQHDLFVVRVDRQHGAKVHFFPYLAINPLNADGVAGRDAILLSPGLNNGVHLSSKR